MQRRDFFLKAGAAATGVLAGCGGETGANGAPAVQANPTIRWRLASSFPRGLETIFGAAETLADRVSALTDNRFQIRPYPAGELVPGLQVLDAVQQGTVQVGHSAGYYFTGKNPALAFDTTVPFGLTARQQNAWLYHGGGLELMRELFADFNVLNFPGGNTGAQMGGWFRREINTTGDLNGLKMRIPGLGGEVMNQLGVTVQVIVGGDIYPALERGVIDAAEWVGPYDDEKLGFHKIARFYYYPGWWEPGPGLSFYVNRQEWERLPGAYQEAFQAAAAEANVGMLARYDAQNPAALQKLLDEGVQLRRFSEAIMQAAFGVAEELMQQQASRDAAYGKVFSSWQAWRAQSFRWFATAEEAFTTFAVAHVAPRAAG